MRLFIINDLNQLENETVVVTDLIIMILDNFGFIYAVRDRLSTDSIIIAPYSYSDNWDVSPYTNYIKKQKLQCMFLVRNSTTLRFDLSKIIKIIPDVDIIDKTNIYLDNTFY